MESRRSLDGRGFNEALRTRNKKVGRFFGSKGLAIRHTCDPARAASGGSCFRGKKGGGFTRERGNIGQDSGMETDVSSVMLHERRERGFRWR